jgi:hypothetical protein
VTSTLGLRSVQYRWVEVKPVLPIENPPCDLWTVRITKPEWLDGGRTWLDSVDYHDLDTACEAAQKVDEAMEAVWQLKLATMDANRAVYNIAADVSSTRQEGVTWRTDWDSGMKVRSENGDSWLV